MKKKFLLALFALASLNCVVNAQALNWPADGGIESWGFTKSDACQPGDGYMAEFSNKFQSIYLYKPESGSPSTARQYVNGSHTNAFIDKLKRGGLSHPITHKSPQ